VGSPAGAPAAVHYDRLVRVVLTDEVCRTLFEEYAAHRASDRGAEEIGWFLLGRRDADEATVLATLPAGTNRDAGEAHVRFNGPAQALGYRIVWQDDRKLTHLGVVHTHPGSLRHPSKGDLRGDRDWVPRVRGGEGVFGIGTADASIEKGRADEPGTSPAGVAHSPRPHTQCLGPLRFSWYALAAGDRRYRELPVGLTIGPDLARPLRPVWAVIEEYADRLDRLARQMARVRFGVTDGKHGPALTVSVGLAEPAQVIRVQLEGKEVRYYYESGGQTMQADLPETPPDQGVYLLLAELAGKS
jgi:proteasome lid subunit RPN8/RPN11